MKFKSEEYKKSLYHNQVDAQYKVSIEKNDSAFQGYKVQRLEEIEFPFLLGSEEIIIDFGNHYTGYLHIELENANESRIADSPINFVFEFAEMPIELMETVERNSTGLSIGWLQKDYKSVAFLPYNGSVERRYAFRYLRIKRVDSIFFPVEIKALYVDSVSSVDMNSVKKCDIKDPLLEKIDRICINTLKECEQDVFEDGPKRDMRLWIGDLRLQSLVDYETFNNIDLIKRCIYLFAEHRNNLGLVAACVYPDTPPYITQGFYLDYSLWFVSCVYEYLINTDDKEFANELYDIALHQIKYTDSVFKREEGLIEAKFFIDHGNYDKTVSSLSVFAYVLRQMILMSEILGKPTEYFQNLIAEVHSVVIKYYSKEEKLFVSPNGEISWHSQIWGTLSGVLPQEECIEILKKTAQINPSVRCSSPYMNHFYLEALYSLGMEKEAIDFIKTYWGAIIDAGFDCCPECFEIGNERLSPYLNPVLNSACHAWSCTPSYWIRKYNK